MSVLLLNASPRERGNTQILLARLAEGLNSAGLRAEIVRLAALRITPCSACGICEQTGVCPVSDDMKALYEKLEQIRHLVIGTPIYFYGLPAHAKAFIDRLQVFWARRYLALPQEKIRVSAGYGYFLGLAATKSAHCFDGARQTLRYAFEAMNLLFQDEVVARGADRPGEVLENQEALQAAFTLGRRIGLASGQAAEKSV